MGFSLAGVAVVLLTVMVAVVAALGTVAGAGGASGRCTVLVAKLIPGLAAILLAGLVHISVLLTVGLSHGTAHPLVRGIESAPVTTHAVAGAETATHAAAGQGQPRSAKPKGGCQQRYKKYFAFHDFLSPFCRGEQSMGQDTVALALLP